MQYSTLSTRDLDFKLNYKDIRRIIRSVNSRLRSNGLLGRLVHLFCTKRDGALQWPAIVVTGKPIFNSDLPVLCFYICKNDTIFVNGITITTGNSIDL